MATGRATDRPGHAVRIAASYAASRVPGLVRHPYRVEIEVGLRASREMDRTYSKLSLVRGPNRPGTAFGFAHMYVSIQRQPISCIASTS